MTEQNLCELLNKKLSVLTAYEFKIQGKDIKCIPDTSIFSQVFFTIIIDCIPPNYFWHISINSQNQNTCTIYKSL